MDVLFQAEELEHLAAGHLANENVNRQFAAKAIDNCVRNNCMKEAKYDGALAVKFTRKAAELRNGTESPMSVQGYLNFVFGR